MELNNEKRSTSIQYQLTNVKLFTEVFRDWKNFNNILKQGPDVMKTYLLQEWNELKKQLENNENILVKDLEKNVTIDDFNVTINRTKNGELVFFFTFPDYEYRDAASKYVALALTKNMPRYFTLEYSEKILTKELCWVVGEFFINSDGKIKHNNYGEVDNNRITWFAGYIMGLLESENL